MSQMQLLTNPGDYEILTPIEELKKQLLRIESAGRTCYQSESKPITDASAENFIRMLLGKGHESVIEHSSLSVKFTGASRGFTHEMVRHRLASPSQESTRYVDYARPGKLDLEGFSLKCVAPAHKDANKKVTLPDGRELSLSDMFAQVEMFYRALRQDGWVPQDARQILPIGIESELVVTANFREWRHIFKMRTTKPAHWEIRSLMVCLLKELKTTIPIIFHDFKEAGVDSNNVSYFRYD